MEEVKRSPGRPKQDPLKKGKPSWKPASHNVFDNLEAGYRYRQMRKDPSNLAKKIQEGWEIVSDIQGSQTEHEAADRIGDYKPITSVREGNDWILGRITEEQAESRDDYYNGVTESKTKGLTAHIKKDLAEKGAAMHGEITISSRNRTQTI